ncbi:hypothetical protein MNBD_ALPHA12-1345 [hydrothermal vent metagenome]|uniref:ATPase BadF/BadG/BcrA/BcrD type domain-containing protein n=1 Tax=hydrothermal vent metagenome TaxID=652676 RepID=A0A3B0UA97_9ZZZZ
MNTKTGPFDFCLDIGGSGTRGALFDRQGHQLARAEATGGALSLGAERSQSAIRGVWGRICAQTDLGEREQKTTRLWAGIAGRGLPGQAKELAALLDDFLQCRFVADGYGALLAATGGKPGALISIGTGVAALSLDENGKTMMLSGWGFPAGDIGGGAWLGLMACSALGKYIDGVDQSPPFPIFLAQEIMEVGGRKPQQFMAWQTKAEPHMFASLAPLVIAGAKKGDQFCHNLLERSAQEIVALATALYGKKTGTVYLRGGLGVPLYPLCRRIAPSFDWQPTEADPVEGIYLLASGQAPSEQILERPNAQNG